MNKRVFYALMLAFGILLHAGGSMAQQPKTKVTLGIKPDYFYSNGGVRVKDVVKSRTAQKAGIKADDIIIAFDNTKIKGIFHYRDLLQKYTSGSKVKVTVKRNKEILYFNTQFE